MSSAIKIVYIYELKSQFACHNMGNVHACSLLSFYSNNAMSVTFYMLVANSPK